MKSFTILKVIVIITIVLPLFYDYWNILPSAAKYLLDLSILVYLLNNKKVFNYRSSFKNLYLSYVAFILFVTIVSILIHNESFFHLFQEFRRLLYPIVFYSIIRYHLNKDNSNSIRVHNLFMKIFYLQIPITIIQIVFFNFFDRKNLFSNDKQFLIDAACGTLGQGGHSYLGILIPIVFIYLSDLKKVKSAYLLFIPFVLANSGGGIVVMGIVLLTIAIYTIVKGSMSHKFAFIFGIVIAITIAVNFLRPQIEYYIEFSEHYQEYHIKKGASTFKDWPYKISRINGYKYFNSKMNKYQLEHLMGLGFRFQEIGINGNPYQFKSDINAVIAERGYLGLFAYWIFFIVLIVLVYNLTVRNKYRVVFLKVLLFVIFFLSGFYNQTTRSFPIWIFIAYFLALIENNSRYNLLYSFLHPRSDSKRP